MRKAGAMTQQRKKIYDLLTSAGDHPTASDIIERLKADGHQFAYATVYNSLKYLTEEGLIHELKLENGACRYDARTDEHQHVVCTVCGKVEETCVPPPAEWLRAVAKQTGFAIAEERILFKGVCGSCSSNETIS
ncbi:Fur family transcriptional regulator [Cohnella soli]|uniref:Fur family transcriptional regulator n=1 Tax=Cohnella soli TaxID=425005 RepID=A0ABW0HWL8_9BACL